MSCGEVIMTDEHRRMNPLANFEETRSKAGGLRRAMQFDPQSEYEAAEFAAASKLGHRRLGRWMNDRLLRRLAGPMTAEDMVDLCSPPPFGEFKQSALHTALKAAPDLWNRLRNVDSDKEAAMLQSWQAHNDAAKRSTAPHGGLTAVQPSAAQQAVHAWHRVNKRGRNALLTMNIERVYVLEDHVLEFLDSEENERHIEVEDAFERCALHALADFHGMHSASVDASTGRLVRLRCSRSRTSTTAVNRTSDAGDVASDFPPSTSDVSATGAASQQDTSLGRRSSTRPEQRQSSGGVDDATKGAPAYIGGADRLEDKEVDDRPSDGDKVGAMPSSAGQELAASVQLPFTAVDIVAVLQEERQAQATLGRHTDSSLTVAALLAHRQEHLPVEMYPPAHESAILP